ncbi:hypothetical protein G5B30_09960 [Sphingobacterium sp. SGG-5]|uniref:polysaccharide lyase 6 family protein n=1 Tax=Sphingobacterium sp. SGG-5 TaxID=2710881 RepID=UPI0013EA03FA|nr:polysaccharide lyase 6 family protein [Sphingobacterium sp. SGG-5]NGM62239.1 hypothetical protein [Sphingobacterium sp. SGG-5]
MKDKKNKITLLIVCMFAWITGTMAQSSNKIPVKSAEELHAAFAKATPGDVIVMKNGVWKDIDIVFKANGTESAPVTLMAETPGQTIISGSSSLRIAGRHLVVDGLYFKDGHSSRPLHLIEFRSGNIPAEHCRLTNVVISSFNKPKGTDVWVGLFGSHNQIDHCLFEGKTSKSVLIIVWRATADANYHRIAHNHFKDMPSIGLGGATAIRIGDGVQALSSSVTTVESNVFENMLGIGKIINIKSGGNIIRGNTFIKASGSICIRQGNGNLIEGNFIFPGMQDNYTGGILVIGENHIIRQNYIQGTRRRGKAAIALYEGQLDNHPGKGGYYPTKNVLIANNTLVDNDKNIVVGQLYNPSKGLTVPVEGIRYVGNVILGNSSATPVIEVLDKPTGEVHYEDNTFFGGNLKGLEGIPGIAIKDPQLTLGADGKYHYSKTNPLRRNLMGLPLKPDQVGPNWRRQ